MSIEQTTTPAQATAAAMRAVARLLDDHPDLPLVSWLLPRSRPGAAAGTAHEDIPAAVAAWAAAMGVGVRERPSPVGTGRSMWEASAWVHGARVVVSGSAVDLRPLCARCEGKGCTWVQTGARYDRADCEECGGTGREGEVRS